MNCVNKAVETRDALFELNMFLFSGTIRESRITTYCIHSEVYLSLVRLSLMYLQS